MINFGVGQLSLMPAGATPTPIPVGILQDCSLDVAFTEKELYGAFQFPVDVARGQGKVSGKAKFGSINGALISAVLAGSAINSGTTAGAINETGVIPSTPFQITAAQSATWTTDTGVIDFTAGIVMTRVVSGPTTGQYSVAAGIYTFATADVGHTVSLNYGYTVAGGTGKTVTFTNQLMGATNTYQLRLFNIYRAKPIGCLLYAVTLPKLSLPFKNEDHTLGDVDFASYADSVGRVIDAYTGD